MHLAIMLKKQVSIWIIPKSRWSLLLTRLTKKGLLTRLTKNIDKNYMLCRNPSILLFHQKRGFTKSTKHINHKHPKNSPTLPPKKPDPLKSIDKSRFTQRTNLSNKITRIENPQKQIFSRTMKIFLFCIEKEMIQHVQHQIIFVFIARMKQRKTQTLQLLENKILENHSTLGKGQMRIL